MRLSIRGVKQCPSMTLRETRYVINFLSNKLLSRRVAKKVSVQLRYQPVEDHWQGGTYHNMDFPHDFVICIDPNMSRQLTLKTLAHEMVHVKQWATNERKDFSKTDLVCFRKQMYDENETSYRELPWEKEASTKEVRLLDQYLRHLKRSGLQF